MTEQPTPEDLVARLQNLPDSSDAMKVVIEQVVRDAEAGGKDHMLAVAKHMASLPPDRPGLAAPAYDRATGRPAFHETNILISCQIRVEGLLFTAREALDPMLYELQFGGTDKFEDYIRFFLGHHFGRMVHDPAGYSLLRSKTQVVRPEDKHDFKRCIDSETGRKLDIRCVVGEIVSGLISTFTEPYPHTLAQKMLGLCPCRCHTAPGLPPNYRRAHLTEPLFDEGMLDENGRPR